jgi:hypothetical protein
MSELLSTFLEILLTNDEDFLKVKETLTRIGVASKKDKKLYQSCHILHKQNKYYIVNFKELFALDGKPATFTEEDKARRNTIALLLEDWNLVTIINKQQFESLVAPINKIKILSHKEKHEWDLIPKYTIGRKKTHYVELV